MRWFRDPISGSTVIIAVATVVNLGVSAGLWLATRDSVDIARHVFEAANRPYVGLESLGVLNDREKKTLDLTAFVKNFGTVPADKAEVKWELLLNGTIQPSESVPDEPGTLFPGETTYLHAYIAPVTYEQVMKGQTTLIIVLRATYKGPGDKSYRYCAKEQYKPKFNAFINLGDCEEQHPDRKS